MPFPLPRFFTLLMPPASSAHLSQPHKPTFKINSAVLKGQNSFSGKDTPSILQKTRTNPFLVDAVQNHKAVKIHVSWPRSRWPWVGPLLLSKQKRGVEQHPHSLSDSRKAENIRGYFLAPYKFHWIRTTGSLENTPKRNTPVIWRLCQVKHC